MADSEQKSVTEVKSDGVIDLTKSDTSDKYQVQEQNQAQNQTQSQAQTKEADFNATEVKPTENEEVRSFFHVTTRYKIIFLCSLVLLLLEGLLIYAAVQGALKVPMWQVSVWALAAACSIYSIVRKSLLGLFLNIVLFFGISLLPVYSEMGERFKPVIDLFTGQ